MKIQTHKCIRCRDASIGEKAITAKGAGRGSLNFSTSSKYGTANIAYISKYINEFWEYSRLI